MMDMKIEEKDNKENLMKNIEVNIMI